jgi:hypothetical protein
MSDVAEGRVENHRDREPPNAIRERCVWEVAGYREDIACTRCITVIVCPNNAEQCSFQSVRRCGGIGGDAFLKERPGSTERPLAVPRRLMRDQFDSCMVMWPAHFLYQQFAVSCCHCQSLAPITDCSRAFSEQREHVNPLARNTAMGLDLFEYAGGLAGDAH